VTLLDAILVKDVKCFNSSSSSSSGSAAMSFVRHQYCVVLASVVTCRMLHAAVAQRALHSIGKTAFQSDVADTSSHLII